MSKVEIKVYALPIEKASDIRNDDGEWVDGKSKLCQNTIKYQYYHIYATTSETPKEGDWFIVEISEDNWETSNFVLEQVETINGIWVNNESYETTRHIDNCKKVVATDDKDLWVRKTSTNCFTEIGACGKISPEFQQAWVREMNNGTPIIEALMEMNLVLTDELDKEADFELYLNEYVPKLNPQGYVTILPVKEKMHTQTEVENLILQFASDCENDEDLICYDGEIDGVKQYNAAKKWLKQNL